MKAYTSPSLDVFCTQEAYCADVLSSDKNAAGFGSNFATVNDPFDD